MNIITVCWLCSSLFTLVCLSKYETLGSGDLMIWWNRSDDLIIWQRSVDATMFSSCSSLIVLGLFGLAIIKTFSQATPSIVGALLGQGVGQGDIMVSLLNWKLLQKNVLALWEEGCQSGRSRPKNVWLSFSWWQISSFVGCDVISVIAYVTRECVLLLLWFSCLDVTLLLLSNLFINSSVGIGKSSIQHTFNSEWNICKSSH